MARNHVAITAVLFTSLLFGCTQKQATVTPDGRVHGVITYVTDGDTVAVRFGSTTEKIRLIGKPEGDDYLLKVDNALVVPVGKKVRVITTANDVIHAFAVPSLGIKQDAIPGFVRDTWFRAERVGDFHGQCQELCGKEHAYMPIHVKVVSAEDYTLWVDAEKKKMAAKADDPSKVWTLEDSLKRGEKVYAANCVACHQATGKGGGAIKALDGAAVVLSADKTKQIMVLLNGQNNQSMPAWKQLSDTEIAAVITFTKNNWSNKTGQVVQPAEVLAARK
jgi:cytochrome c oxidase subunit 2